MTAQIEKHFLQKVSGVCSVLGFVSAAICALILVLYAGELSNIYRASFAASIFFFCSVGFVLKVIAGTNLPNFQGSNIADSKERDES